MMRRLRRALCFAALPVAGALAFGQGCSERPPEAVPKDSLLVLVPALPAEFDPFADSGGSGDLVYHNVFDPLLRSSPAGEIAGVLAQSWDASKAGELSVRLKPGLRFHDGTAVGAKEVVASLEAARASGSSVGARLADVAEVRAGESGEVLLRAVSGASLTPQMLADVPIVKPVPGGMPGGTGAYRVSAFTAGESATLVAAEGRPAKPELTRISVRRFHGTDEVQREFLGPVAPVVASPPAEVLALARANPRYRVVIQPGRDLIVLAMDLGRDPTPGIGLPANPFRKPQARRALRLAIDRTAAGKSIEGGAVPAMQLALPITFGIDPTLEVPAPRVEEARSLLRAAGLSKGFDVRLDFAQANEPIARAVAAQLATVGIRARLNPLKEERLADVMHYESSLALLAWAPGQDPEPALRSAVHTRVAERGFGGLNWTGFTDPEVDRGIEKALAAADPAARREAIQATLRRLSEDSAWIPLVVPNAVLVLPKGMTYPARPDGRITLAEARLEPTDTQSPPGK